MKILAIALVGMFSLISGGTPPPATTEIAIIVNSENPVDKLSITEARNYWMRKGAQKIWPGLKLSVLPVDRKNACDEKTIFYTKLVGLAEADVESYFAAKQYQNAEKPPVKFSTDSDIINYVAENKAALGFVATQSVKGDVKVKVVLTVAQ